MVKTRSWKLEKNGQEITESGKRIGRILPSMQDFRELVCPSKNFIWSYINKGVLLFVIFPATGDATFLHYVIPEKDLAADEASSAW
jgi:hypothetical protein